MNEDKEAKTLASTYFSTDKAEISELLDQYQMRVHTLENRPPVARRTSEYPMHASRTYNATKPITHVGSDNSDDSIFAFLAVAMPYLIIVGVVFNWFKDWLIANPIALVILLIISIPWLCAIFTMMEELN